MNPAIQTLLPEISHGHHCCLLFSSPADQIQMTAPFLGLGLARNERCVYVADQDSIEQLREAMKSQGISVDSEIRKNRLVLSSERDYLDDGRFSPEKMLAFLQQAYDAAMADGYTALRAAGDVSWQVGADQDFGNVVYYETLLDLFFLGKKMVGMCQYPRGKCPPEVLNGVLNTHKIAAIDYELCQNFHYVPPEILVERDKKLREEKRVEWMTSHLLRVKEAEAEIIRLNESLEKKVIERTAELQAAFHDMESFSYSVSHDLRAPLRSVLGFGKVLFEDHLASLSGDARDCLLRIQGAAERMDKLVDGLLKLSRLSRTELAREQVSLSGLAGEVLADLQASQPARKVSVLIAPEVGASGDRELLRVVLTNLLSNAWKFSSKKADARIEFGVTSQNGEPVFFVRDNGAGFDSRYSSRLFGAFQRLHSLDQFDGSGIGLATVQRIIRRHGGRIWAQGEVGRGATFYFTLPENASSDRP